MSDLTSFDHLAAAAPTVPLPPLQRRATRCRVFRSVGALVLREMTTTYGRSPGGYVWAILEPVGGIAVMSIVFSLVLRSPPLGTSFVLFYALGILTFGLYGSIMGVTSAAIQYSRALLAYPAVTFMDALIARILLNLLTHLIVMVIVLGAIILYYELNVMIDWDAVMLAIGMVVTMGIGVGSVNCFLNNRFPVWKMVWGIITKPLFLISGVLFIPENVPAAARHILMYNPLIHATSEIRKGFYPTYDAIHVVPFYPYAVALVLTLFGFLLLLRYHKEIILR